MDSNRRPPSHSHRHRNRHGEDTGDDDVTNADNYQDNKETTSSSSSVASRPEPALDDVSSGGGGGGGGGVNTADNRNVNKTSHQDDDAQAKEQNGDSSDDLFILQVIAERAARARQDIESETAAAVLTCSNDLDTILPALTTPHNLSSSVTRGFSPSNNNGGANSNKSDIPHCNNADGEDHDHDHDHSNKVAFDATTPNHNTGGIAATELVRQQTRIYREPGAFHVQPLVDGLLSARENVLDTSYNSQGYHSRNHNCNNNNATNEQPNTSTFLRCVDGFLPATLVVNDTDSNDDKPNSNGTFVEDENSSASGDGAVSAVEVFDGQVVLSDNQESMRRRCFLGASLVGIVIMVVVIVLLVLGLAGLFAGTDDVMDSGLVMMGSLRGNTTTTTTNSAGDVRGEGNTLKSPQYSPTLARIQADGFLKCVHTEHFIADFEIALCQVLAAAILGDADKVQLVVIPATERFTKLANEEVDVLVRTTTHTMERDVSEIGTGESFDFSIPYLYDGTKLAGRPFFVQCADNDMKHINECSGLRVCVMSETTQLETLSKWLPERYFVFWRDNLQELADLLNNGTCNIMAQERYSLSEPFVRSGGYQGDYAISDTYFSKEPLAMATRSNDPVFSDFVNTVLESLLVAERYNITQDKAATFPQTQVFGHVYENMFRNAVSVGGHFGQLYESFLEEFHPRDDLNLINDGTSGLMRSRPLGVISNKRDENKPLGSSLQNVLDRGLLRCGVRGDRPGFAARSTRDDYTSFDGLDIDFCRALASALFAGNDEAVEYVLYDDQSESGFTSLADGDIDVLAGATRNLQNDVKEPTTGRGFSFSQPYFYGFSPEEDNLCLATRQDDKDWSSFVYWVVDGIFYAEEEGITQEGSNKMPEIFLFGSDFFRMFRDVVLASGNYGEMYERNVEALIPRAGRNNLNSQQPGLGPQHYPLPGFFPLDY